MVRVTHPHHPMYNQNVKVLRRAGHPAYPEPSYLIELPDGSRAEIPRVWTESPPGEADRELWAGIEQFLILAALVDALSSSVAEEVAHEKCKR